MNFGPIFSALGLLVGLVGLFMIPSLGWSICLRDGMILEWLASIGINVGVGAALWFTGRRGKGEILQREALAIVGLGWVVTALGGSIPFLADGHVSGLADAFFETMSGFTTTGSTILTDIEALPHSLLFWRSTTHWLGGIGIIVLFVAILPFFSSARRRLYASEIPGVSAEGLTPRIKQTAMAMLKIYVTLSAVEFVLLMFGGMNMFDSLCHTFGTMATGGFSTKNASVAYFDSPGYHGAYIEWVIIVFMFLAGCNFTLHYFFAHKKWTVHLRDVEFRHYASIILIVSVSFAFLLWIHDHAFNPLHGFRISTFTAVSVMTSTGFVTVDFDNWPNYMRGILVLMMFIGGCGGSTGGGLKVIRFVVLFRHLFAQIERNYSPRTVRQVKLGGKALDDSLTYAVLGYFFVAIALTGLFTIILSALEHDMSLISCFTAVATTINNIGPGLEAVGATESFAFLSAPSKWLLSCSMMLGRLEFFSVLVLFAPRFWTKV